MTQDALPSSDRWLYNLYCALENGDNIAAVSCREFVKNDADLYYRVFTAHHYSYLGVLENDAVFTMPESRDSDLIRQNSQLSDITCFMRHETFMKYKYRGGFAEDLDLGMRLIEDGYNLAFLGNEVSIHSHNRDAYYYLKRRFVELKTLEEIVSNPTILNDVKEEMKKIFVPIKEQEAFKYCSIYKNIKE